MAFLHSPHFQALDSSGNPLSGALLTFYATGTTTEITVYQDAGLTTPHTNPVVADASGRFPPIYLSSTLYKTQLANSGGSVVQTIDPVYGDTFTQGQYPFPATQNPSADANTLDDYEEGTFTPTIKGSTSGGAGTYTLQEGRYTKIGNIVHIKLAVTWTNSTGTGNLVVGGLPFNSPLSNARDVMSVVSTGVTLTANNYALALKTANNADISIEQSPVGGGSLTPVPMDTSGTLIISGTYFAA